MAATRDRYADVGAAMRQSVRRANAAALGVGDYRVLAAVLEVTASWSRLEVAIDATGLAPLAGMSVRRTRDRLGHLAELSVITWKPKRGIRPDGKPRSRVGLPPADPIRTLIASGLKQDAQTSGLPKAKQDAQARSNRTPSRPVLRGTRSKVPAAAPHAGTADTLQARAVIAYRSTGGSLDLERSRGALARSVKTLANGGTPEATILAACRQLGREGAFPGYLAQTVERLKAEGGPCAWHGADRARLTPAQLAECRCNTCGEWAAFHGQNAGEVRPKGRTRNTTTQVTTDVD